MAETTFDPQPHSCATSCAQEVMPSCNSEVTNKFIDIGINMAESIVDIDIVQSKNRLGGRAFESEPDEFAVAKNALAVVHQRCDAIYGRFSTAVVHGELSYRCIHLLRSQDAYDMDPGYRLAPFDGESNMVFEFLNSRLTVKLVLNPVKAQVRPQDFM
jgi:hypothetical protein